MTVAFNIVIPARYASTRLPAKALRDIAGKPMIQRVYQQALQANAERVIVATDDQRIADVVIAFGGEVQMTSLDHPSGTDRLAEVAKKCGFDSDAIVVNVQGDEPLIPPQVICQVAQNLADNADAAVATLCEPITSSDDFSNPNIVKLVANERNMALYFSRAPIPWPRDHILAGKSGLPSGMEPKRHLGIYAYRVNQLQAFVGWPVAPLERIERLEQLRFLWHGERIHVVDSCAAVPGGVDTEDDLQRVIAIIKAQVVKAQK